MKPITIHPFPGLRPFEENEEHLFFGREKCVTELLSRLRVSRFLAVIGTSGSGKSSLVKSGLLPSLYRGFMAKAGSHWRTAIFRPGDNPIGNMAEALVKAGLLSQGTAQTGNEPDMSPIHGKFSETTLRRSSMGLIDVVKQSRLEAHENLLVVVDQFEELFRFSKLERSSKKDGKRDSLAFIKLLLENTRNNDFPIYVMLTMRSDFLGDCTEFQGLPEAINESQYLIPRMTRDEKRAAITGPVAVGGGTIAPSLLSRLLNDVGDNPDHLPILQHALMRTWDYWLENRRDDEPMGLKHYQAIGAMESALSLHAEEAFAELKNERSRKVCEMMYKLITDMGETGRGVRRPAKVSEICLATNASKEEVIRVVDVFRQPGRTFLMPPHGVELDGDSVIDISHESYMRIWTRLIDWVKEEAQSAELYLRLAKDAALYEEGKVALWRDPELMLALNWREENKPNAVWAERYDPSFDRAINFLETSKKQKDLEIAEKEREQRLKIKRTRIFAAVIGIAALIAIALAFWALNSEKEATRQKQEAIKQQQIAEKNEKEARDQKDRAEKNEKIAQEQKEKAEKNEQEATEQRAEAEKQKILAENNEVTAKKEEKKAKENAVLEKIQGLIVDMNKEEANFRQYLTKAKELAVQSLAIPPTGDKELKALLALTAYRLDDRAYDYLEEKAGDVINGFDKKQLDLFPDKQEIHDKYNEAAKLYENLRQTSQNKLQPPEIFAALREAYIANEESKDIAYENVESWALVTNGDNHIIFNNREGQLLTAPLQFPAPALPIINKKDVVALSGGGTFYQASSFADTPDRLFCGTLAGNIFYWEKDNRQKKTLPIKQDSKILAMAFSKNKNYLFYSVKDTVYLYRLNAGQAPEPIISGNKNNYILIMAVIEGTGSESGDPYLVTGDENGNIYQVNISGDMKNNRSEKLNTAFQSGGAGIHAMAVDPGRGFLAAADSRGEIHLFQGIDGKSLAAGKQIPYYTFETTNKGIVNILAFSPGGRYLASGGMDGSIMLWDLKQESGANFARQAPALTITGKQKILSLVFEPGGEYILFNDELNLRICPTRPVKFFEILCRGKKKDLSLQEWKQYIGEFVKQQDIDICSDAKEK